MLDWAGYRILRPLMLDRADYRILRPLMLIQTGYRVLLALMLDRAGCRILRPLMLDEATCRCSFCFQLACLTCQCPGQLCFLKSCHTTNFCAPLKEETQGDEVVARHELMRQLMILLTLMSGSIRFYAFRFGGYRLFGEKVSVHKENVSCLELPDMRPTELFFVASIADYDSDAISDISFGKYTVSITFLFMFFILRINFLTVSKFFF